MVARGRCQLLQHAGFANAWFALQEDQLPLATTGGGKGSLQDSHFPCATDPVLGCRGRRNRKTRQDAKVLLLHIVVLSTRPSNKNQPGFNVRCCLLFCHSASVSCLYSSASVSCLYSIAILWGLVQVFVWDTCGR